MPKNIAELLYVVTTLLGFGRHLSATIERRAAAPGFARIAELFGTANVRIILAHLHRGILRATALQALLLKRAATGRDITIGPPRIPRLSAAAANGGVPPAPLTPGITGLATATGRPRSDAPIDPDHLPTLEAIEAEVSNRAFGRTINDICDDFGVVAGLCTGEFWDALMVAIACYDGSAMACFETMFSRSDQFQQEQENAPESERIDQGGPLSVHHVLGFKLGQPPVELYGAEPAADEPCNPAPAVTEAADATAGTTGPPQPGATMRFAA